MVHYHHTRLSPPLDLPEIGIRKVATRWNKARSLIGSYFFSHWNTLEWIFTARLLFAGLILVNRGNVVGYFLLGLGIFGACVSGQWVRNFWLNISFSVVVFSLSVGLALLHLSKGSFTNILLYIHVLDIALSVWLCKRITEERFYHDVSGNHGN
jgi:hypothetical protein